MSGSAPSHRILFATAELAPWSQVGGLGEVAASLPPALAERGHEVIVVTPLHRRIRRAGPGLRPLETTVRFDFAHHAREVGLHEDPDAAVRTIYLEAPDFFETEDDLYGDDRGEGGVGHLRWLFFSAVLRPVARALGFAPEIVHVHDWHGALGCALDRVEHHFEPDAAGAAWVLTVHNGAHHGRIGRDTWREAGLREDLMVEPVLLEGGDPVLLKAGLALADGLTTVSPTYARDLVEGDAGGVLRPWYEARAEDLVGILNGIDPAVWDPATDPYLPASFDADDLSGKARCREALRAELGLERREGPLFGVVARLDPQKGLDLLLGAADRLLAESDGTLAVLGRGAPDIEEDLRRLARRHPGRVAPRFRFDAPLAHRIEAGADLFLMPSRFEPCGLNQMISQRYGTPPVARRTGGLADTIRAFGEHEAPDGFLFDDAEPEAFLAAALEATRRWREDPETFVALRDRGMRRDHGWGARVDDYLAAYDRALEARRAGARDAVLDDLQLEPREPFLAPQRAIPTHYRRDLLRLMVVDPRRIHAYWEVQGEAGRAALEALTDEERWESRWELRCEELTSGARWEVAVEGIAKNWFLEVEADRRYRAELWMTAGGREPVRFAGSEIVVTPPEAGA